MTRYRPASQYLPASLVAAGLALFSTWCGLRWPFAFIAAGLFVVSAAVLYYLGSRPPVEVDESTLKIGGQLIRWNEVERIDSTAWTSPLVVLLSLKGGRRLRVIYPGDVEAADRLSRHMRRMARHALIDGVPYRQYWGNTWPQPDPPALQPPKIRLLRPEDEEEVERIYRRLKAVRRSDERSSSEERWD